MQAIKPRFDHRFTVEHYTISTPSQARRMAKLGALASVNIYFASYRSLLHSSDGYGPDRSEAFARLGSGSAGSGLDGKTVMAPGERIGVERAFRAVTIDAAYVIGMEDKVGSLEPGKYADFAILEEDPFEVDPMTIKDVPIWGTVLSGELHKSAR